MTPFFDPGPNPYGQPKIFLAGVGELMTEVAGEVADGFLAHGFTTERYLREVTLPALERGAAKAGKTRADLDRLLPRLRGHRAATRRAPRPPPRRCASRSRSTVDAGLRPVLELHGWGDLQPSSTRCPSGASG